MQSLQLELSEAVTVSVGPERIKLDSQRGFLQVRSTSPPSVMYIKRRNGNEYKVMHRCVDTGWWSAGVVQCQVGTIIVFDVGNERLNMEVVRDEPFGLRLAVEKGRQLEPRIVAE